MTHTDHKWRFACPIRNSYVEDRIDISSELKIPRPVVVPSQEYKLLFYCECGELRTVSVSGNSIGWQLETPSIKIS